jgi:lipopolysaccharide/colanic/teichoic acid biosynthesis glycosyltransferase
LAEVRDARAIDARAVVLPADALDGAAALGNVPTVAATDVSLHAWRDRGVKLLVVGEARSDCVRALLSRGAGTGYLVASVRDIVATAAGRVGLDADGDLSVLATLTRSAEPRAAERAVDLVLGGTLLLASLPLWPIIGLIVKLGSPGPVFCRQVRVGRWARPFGIFKFRTMREDAEKGSVPASSPLNDSRTTLAGRFLRSTRLDGLPQLWNVLRGDMSLVGPRPERPCFVSVLSARFPLYAARHAVRPGLTGWAQVRCPCGSSEEDAREKLAYDLFYVLNRSLAFYFAVLLETARILLFRRGGR